MKQKRWVRMNISYRERNRRTKRNFENTVKYGENMTKVQEK